MSAPSSVRSAASFAVGHPPPFRARRRRPPVGALLTLGLGIAAVAAEPLLFAPVAIAADATPVTPPVTPATPDANQAGSPIDALNQILGAMSGKQAPSRPPIDREKLRDLLPAELAGERRTRLKSGVNEMLGFRGGYAEADYGSGDRKMTIKLSDMGSIGAMAIAVGQISEEETDTTSERTWRDEGRLYQLRADTGNRSVDYTVNFASGVVLELDARGYTVDEVKGAVTTIGPAKIDALGATGT